VLALTLGSGLALTLALTLALALVLALTLGSGLALTFALPLDLPAPIASLPWSKPRERHHPTLYRICSLILDSCHSAAQGNRLL
jgi:hypothetical protein